MRCALHILKPRGCAAGTKIHPPLHPRAAPEPVLIFPAIHIAEDSREAWITVREYRGLLALFKFHGYCRHPLENTLLPRQTPRPLARPPGNPLPFRNLNLPRLIAPDDLAR